VVGQHDLSYRNCIVVWAHSAVFVIWYSWCVNRHQSRAAIQTISTGVPV